VLSTFCRKPIFGYRAMVYAILGIAILSTSVWGHHMFISGMNPYTAFAFSLLTVAIGVPSAIKTFNWLGTIWGGRVQFTSANLFALGFVSLFVTGGITGIFLAQPAVDLPLHDTPFVVAHFHLVMGVAAIFGMFAGTFYWFPKMFGRMMDETLGKIHFWITLVGVYCIFFPMHFMGFSGQLRRYFDISAYKYLADMPPLQIFITVIAIITAVAQLIFVFNIFWSLAKGRRAEVNPWRCTTLEWTVPSPPPHDNFAGHPPVVHRGAYEYSVPGAKEDFVLQSEPGVPAGKH
jgi:cytochrome c oxidase subunit 1